MESEVVLGTVNHRVGRGLPRSNLSCFGMTLGITWHGIMLYVLANREEDEVDAVQDFEIYYFDHVQANGNKQDTLCVFTILEAFFIRVKKELPHIETLSLQSDNAKCYQACELVLYAYLLSKHYDLKVTTLIHTETQDGKGAIDGHFAIAMRHVLRMVCSGHNAVTPAQLVSLLRSNGGLSNSYPELFSMDRDKLSVLTSKYSSTLKRLERLGRWNEVRIVCGANGDDSIHIYEYSGQDPVIVNLSALLKADDVQAPSDPPPTVVSEPVVSRPEDEMVDTEGEVEQDEEEDLLIDVEDPEPDDSERLVGPLSGVIIESDAHIARLKKRWKKVAKASLEDMVTGDVPEAMCEACHRMFSSKAFLSRHVCTGEPQKRDAISYCCTRAVQMYESGSLDVVVATHDRNEYDASVMENVHIVEGFDSGWARRPPHGSFYGTKYIDCFRDEIVEMFETGERSSSDKMCRFYVCTTHLHFVIF